ncbi:succinyl-diaminopimelate desuccinylase [Myceligenerans salitolerans]|uniref:Succinyl-diaminopimelate desuccinylase n=1 Tax=Myceligenerans salitolerans TaxID=1230528 RepID=A0ABS3I4N5_9MICO|nr:succinyl-diaminopimelate desuccinylase [Myceligenerans salitolerans]MBO0607961.1 succinyl-diaminopimelate desuccinylase [Myceligenerans salitolerans]
MTAFDEALLAPDSDLVGLTAAICDIPSVSGDEAALADAIEATLRARPHLEVHRDGDAIVARTGFGRDRRVVVAGHIDTVPVADNLPTRLEARPDRPSGGEDAPPEGPLPEGPLPEGVGPEGPGDGGSRPRDERVLWGRGTVDMKGGVAVALALACELGTPGRVPAVDVTWVFYDHEEVEAARNGLGRLARNDPGLLDADFAILGEPSNAGIEGGCNGTMRVEVRTRGVAAHSARSWTGVNAIHGAADVLARLAGYRPRTVTVEGLDYREGLNAVGIRGGIAGNVVPDECVVEVNYRFAPSRGEAEAERHLREVFEGFDVTVTDSSPGARPGLDAPMAQDFAAAVLAVTGGEPRPKYGWTDVARFAGLGIPAVNFGPGDALLAHKDDEHLRVAELAACRDALRAWLLG